MPPFPPRAGLWLPVPCRGAWRPSVRQTRPAVPKSRCLRGPGRVLPAPQGPWVAAYVRANCSWTTWNIPPECVRSYLEGKAHTLLGRVLQAECGGVAVRSRCDGELREIQILIANADLDGIDGLVDIRAKAKDIQARISDLRAVHDSQSSPRQFTRERALCLALKMTVTFGAVLGLQSELCHHPKLLGLGDLGESVLFALGSESRHQTVYGRVVVDVCFIRLALVAHHAVIDHELVVVVVVPGFTEVKYSLIVAFVCADNAAHSRPFLNHSALVLLVPSTSNGAFMASTASRRAAHSARMVSTVSAGYPMPALWSSNSSSSSTNTP